MRKRLAEATAAATLLVLSGCSGPFSTLAPAGPAADSLVPLIWAMIAVGLVVLLGVTLLWLYAMRRNPKTISDSEAQRVQNRWILAGGIALPTIAIGLLLTFGIPVGHNMLPLPLQEGKVMRVDVKAHQWYWRVSYPDTGILLVDEIHIPVNTPIDFHISSEDVIHSFWLPRFGGKVDAIPGRTNVLRLEANQAGVYRGQCAEFCGQGHAFMQFRVIAHDAEEFNEWLAQEMSENNERSE